VLGNKPASGTEIIAELGAEHVRTGKPIVYTSADSVFQVAAHEQVIPLEELYRICRIAREILDGTDRVARVIARPFVGQPGSFKRTGNRKDYAVPPPDKTLLDRVKAAGLATIGVGKIPSIFDFVALPISSKLITMRNPSIRLFERLIGLRTGSYSSIWSTSTCCGAIAGTARGMRRDWNTATRGSRKC